MLRGDFFEKLRVLLVVAVFATMTGCALWISEGLRGATPPSKRAVRARGFAARIPKAEIEAAIREVERAGQKFPRGRRKR